MESTRDIRRMIDKEIKKGSAPLTFEHIDYRPNALQEITSELMQLRKSPLNRS